MILWLKIWLQKLIKHDHFYTKNENSTAQRFFAGTIKPWKLLALTISYNISEN
mgnify:CR=1 FL=1